jgi:hypothetical protein
MGALTLPSQPGDTRSHAVEGIPGRSWFTAARIGAIVATGLMPGWFVRDARHVGVGIDVGSGQSPSPTPLPTTNPEVSLLPDPSW